MTFTWGNRRFVAVALFVFAFVPRLAGVVADLPHIYDYDEPLFMTYEVGRMYGESTLRPSGYAHPALYKDLGVAVLTAAKPFTHWDGGDTIASAGVFGDRVARNSGPYLLVRGLFAALVALAVVGVWDAARRLGAGPRVSVWAAVCAASSPLLLSIAPRVAPDGVSAVTAFGVIWAFAWVLEKPSLHRQAMLGAMVGFAGAAKYNAAPFALLAIVPAVAFVRSWGRRALWVAVAGAAAVLAFLVSNPFAIVEFSHFSEELRTQDSVYSFVLTGSTGRSFVFNLRTMLDNAGPMAVLALLPIPALVLRRYRLGRSVRTRAVVDVDVELLAVVSVTLAIVGWWFLQGSFSVRVDRNVMPLVLPVCLLGALTVRPMAEWFRALPARRRLLRRVAMPTVVLFAAWTGFQGAKAAFDLGRDVADERADARDWLLDNVRPGDVLLGEFGTPYLGRDDIEQREVGYLFEASNEELGSGEVDWLVVTSLGSDAYFADSARYPGQIDAARERMAQVCEWHSFDSWNTEIRVGRLCASLDADA